MVISRSLGKRSLAMYPNAYGVLTNAVTHRCLCRGRHRLCRHPHRGPAALLLIVGGAALFGHELTALAGAVGVAGGAFELPLGTKWYNGLPVYLLRI